MHQSRLEGGRYIRYDNEAHAKLYVAICQLMGLTNDTFGDARSGRGPLEGLFT